MIGQVQVSEFVSEIEMNSMELVSHYVYGVLFDVKRMITRWET